MIEKFLNADPIIFLEHGITKGAFSYGIYYEALNIQKIYEKTMERPSYTFDTSTTQLEKTNITKYDYSETRPVPEKPSITESDSLTAVNALISICKQDGEKRGATHRYEPFLTQIS